MRLQLGTLQTQAKPPSTYWDDATKASVITLSNGNRTAFAGNPGPAFAAARTGVTRTGGLYYFEIAIDDPASSLRVGVMTAAAFASTANVGNTGADGVGYDVGIGQIRWSNSDVIAAPTVGLGGVVKGALNLNTGNVWLGPVGGSYNNNGSANPATGVGGISQPLLIGVPCVIVVSFNDRDDVTDAQVTLNSGHANYAGARPGPTWLNF